MEFFEQLLQLQDLSPEAMLELLSCFSFPFLLGFVILLLINSIYGYRLFRFSLAIGGAVGFGMFGYIVLGTLVVGWLDGTAILDVINIPAVLGLILAGIGGMIMFALYKLAIFLTGGFAGFILGSSLINFLSERLTDVEFFKGQVGYWVISIATAIVAGLIFLALFKLLYIIITSVGGLALAGALLGSTVSPTPNIIPVIIFAIFGLVGGLFATVKQFKLAEEDV